MKRSVWMALGLGIAVLAWIVSGSLVRAKDPAAHVDIAAQASAMKVSVRDLQAGEVQREVVIQGDLEPQRRVQIRAETAGKVAQLPVEKGAAVEAGDLIMVLEENDRRVQLAKAKADVESKQLEVQAMQRLKEKGLQAENHLKAAQAELAAALAERARIGLDLERVRLHAPFGGVVEEREPELGSLVQVGDVVAELVDQSRLKAVGHVPQQSAGPIGLGQRVQIHLLDGRTAEGVLTYVAPVADAATRSFRVEAEVDNAEGRFRAGVSAELRIAVATEKAHFLSPAALTLDDLGRVGVKSVDAANRVQFHPVDLIRSEAEGIWVSGLPAQLRLVIRGQGFIAVGETVDPMVDS